MLKNFEIERMLPRFLLQDRNGYALAKAMETLFLKLDEIADKAIASTLDVAHMSEARLDEVAWELNAEWYDWEADIETKRAVIAGAQEFYDRIGTPYAIERAISDVFGTGVIEEWWEYGGEPYHFRVMTTNASALMENREKFMKLLDIVKNERSELDNIYYYGSSSAAAVYAGTAVTGIYGRAGATARNYKEV